MQINNDTFKKISAMSDDDLAKFISSVAKDNNLSIPMPSLTDIARIRAALSGVSQNDPEIMKAVNDASRIIKKDSHSPS